MDGERIMKVVLMLAMACTVFGQNTQTTTRLNIRPYTPSGAGSSLGEIRFYEISPSGGSYVRLIGQPSVNANYTISLPKTTATLLAEINYHYHNSQALSWSAWRARGTEASPTDLTAGDGIVTLTAIGMQSSAWTAFANISMGYGGTNQGYIDFSTRNASGYTARINISSDGHIWPYGSSTQDVGFSSGRFRKGWFADLDVSGTCTGCGGAPPITWTLETNADILTMQHHLASGSVARNILSQYSRGTNTSPTAAAAGDSVWTEKWQYYAGGAYRDAGGIFVNVPSGATVSGTSSPGHISIFATKHSETAGTEVVRFGAQTFSETPAFGAKFFAGAFPSANLTLDLGAFGAEWLTIWASRHSTSGTTDLEFYPGNALRWTMDAGDFGSLILASDAATKIGSQSAKLHSIWSMAYNTYTHNSWGTQTNAWAADQSLYLRMSSYGTSYINAVEMRKARGTQASPTAVADTDILGYQLYEGYSPSGAYAFSAYIGAYVDGTPSGSVVPGALSISTMNSSGTAAARFIVRASGAIEIPGNLTVSGTCTGCGSTAPPIDWYLNSGSTVVTLGNHGTVSASQLTSRFSRGTNASPTDAATNDLVGNHTFRYYAGGAYRDAAAIWVGVPASGVTISGSSSPAFIALFATQDGSTAGSEVMRFGALGGSFGFGTMTGQKIIPSSNLSVDFGAFGAEWLTVWASRIRTSSSTAIDFYPGNTHRWTMTTGAGSLSPVTDAGPNIGNQITKPNEIWAMSHRTYTHNSWGTQTNNFTADNNLNVILSTFSGSAASDRASLQFFRYRGTQASPSAVQSGDQLGNIAFQGMGSSSAGVGAVIRAYAAATPGTNFVQTDMHFEVANSGGTLLGGLILRSNGEADFYSYVDATSGFKYNGTAGTTATINVRNAADTGSCALVVQGGIITSTTC